MASESSVSKPATHQALNGDYKGSGYHKRHLYPVFHTNTQSCADSTFTLTNAAPQHPSFNMGEWKSMENGLEKLLDKDCLPNKAFVVTGVVPSLNPAQFTTNGRVNVPSHFWNAYCCLNNNDKPLFSGGYLSSNDKDPGKPFTSASALDQDLTNLYPAPFQVFGGQCG